MDNDSRVYVKPRIIRLLRALGLDVVYERGEGDSIFYRDGQGREVEVLDLVGGFGALLLGHNYPPLVAEAQRLLSTGRPVHVQGSRRELAERLARELSRRVPGDFCVVFGNSGAEAVEAAMKHAMLETGGRTFLSLNRAFHGKTLGAIQLNGNDEYRAGFELSGMSVVRIRADDMSSLESAFVRSNDIAGFIFEPIQAEGGVRPVDPAFAQRAAELCKQRGVPLIADECQTGMGRTGTFLACEALGVQPDYCILSKALGGGLAKISALLIRRDCYLDSFDLQHSSTFAEDDFSCAIALKSLELIDPPMLARCRDTGMELLRRLRQLQARYPEVIADVRGAGLLIGVEFSRVKEWSSFVLRLLSSQEDLVYLLAAHLFHEHRVRIAPTLSDPFTLRIEPSTFLRDAAIDRLVSGLNDVCARLRDQDALGLTRFLIDRVESVPRNGLGPVRSSAKPFAYDESHGSHRDRRGPEVRVAWLCHLIEAGDLAALDPAFDALSYQSREAYLNRFAAFANPVVMSAADIRSRCGTVVRLYPIMLPVSSRTIKRWIDERHVAMVHGLVQKSVEVARTLGCSVVSLGQYTSIGTSGGRSLKVTDMGLTNGNSFTVALVIQAVRKAERDRGGAPSESVLAVVGAAGSVGRVCAEILAPTYRRTILVGSGKPGSKSRLNRLARRISHAEIATEVSAIAAADTVIVAVNAVDPLLGPEHFGHHALVCDASVPSAVRPDTATLRPDLVMIKGGVVQLPFGEDVGIPGFPLPTGQVYGCMAEAVILGFEGANEMNFTGSLTPAHVRFMEERAARHGFELAEFSAVPITAGNPRRALRVYAR